MAEGYTRIDNSILDALPKMGLNGQEYAILLFIIRHTIGFHRHAAGLSNGFISQGTGISVKSVERIIRRLSSKGIISTKITGGKNPKIITIHLSEYIDQFTTIKSVPDYPQIGGGYTHESVGGNTHKLVGEEIKEKENLKNIYKKGGKPPQTQKFNSFHNFEQRDDIDWDALADQLDADFANMEFGEF